MPRRPQVNLTLSEPENRVLEALAYLQRCSKAEVLRDPVREFLEQQANEPKVRELLQSRENGLGQPDSD